MRYQRRNIPETSNVRELKTFTSIHSISTYLHACMKICNRIFGFLLLRFLKSEDDVSFGIELRVVCPVGVPRRVRESHVTYRYRLHNFH